MTMIIIRSVIYIYYYNITNQLLLLYYSYSTYNQQNIK